MPGSKIENNNNRLIDRFGRVHNYLRLSITDQCNFACTYCKPDNKLCQASNGIMSSEEIIELAKAFTNNGINKIRLTGGEPLVRNDLEEIIQKLGKLSAELAITTNGYMLDRYFNTLKSAGVKKLNISLDTLKRERFNAITQRKRNNNNFPDNILMDIKLTQQMIDIMLETAIVGGVPKGWVEKFD